MKVLLLGASGLLGGNVLLELLRQQHEVVLFLRSHPSAASPAGRVNDDPRCTTFFLPDLSFPNLCKAVVGCDAVVNCAGTTNMALTTLDDFRPVNRDLCADLLRLVEAASLRVLVHISSADTIGYGSPDAYADEDTPMAPPFTHSFYAQSKAEGELLLLRYAETHQQARIVILNPGFMVGPYDVKPSSGQLLLAAYRKPLMVVPSGGKAFVPVVDVAVAVVNALAMGRSGQRYLLTAECLTLKGFYALQADVMGYRQRCFVLPDWMVLLAGRVGDMLAACGIATQLSSRNVRQLLVSEYYDSGKARRELAFSATPLSDAVAAFFSSRGS